MNNPSDTTEQSPCPTKQMSFGDAVRYLQGGFDEPVQKAIAAHVQYCNACQEQLEHFRALRRTGGQLLSGPQIEQATTESQLTDATLAAYLDGALPDKDHDLVTQQIASNYDNYVRFSSLKSELNNPLDRSFSPPMAAIDKAKIAIPETVHTEWRTPFEVVVERLTQSVQTLLALKWPAPAMAFAVGAIVMMVLSPGAETIIAIPGLTPPGIATEDSHVRSGLSDEDVTSVVVDLVIPVKKRQDVSFTWSPVANVPIELYRVQVVGPDGASAIDQILTEYPTASISADALDHGTPYTLNVMASLRNGGLMPVARYTFSLIEQ